MKTLENSLIKLQETTNDQQLQLNILDENKSQCNSVHPEVKQELFDLRTKIDSLLKTIEIQQNTLSELVAKNGDLSSRVICNDKGMQTEALSQNSNSSYSSGTLDEGTSLVDEELPQKASHKTSDATTSTVVSQPTHSCGNCNAQFSQLFCLLAIMWNQLEYQRENSLLTHINIDHTYSKAKAKKPNTDEVGEEKKEVTVFPPPSNIILSEEEIEVCETIDVWECDDVFEAPPQAIPVLKTLSSDTPKIPIKVNLNHENDGNSKDSLSSHINGIEQQAQHLTTTPVEVCVTKEKDITNKAKTNNTAPLEANTNHPSNTQVRQSRRSNAPQTPQKRKCLIAYDNLFNDFDSDRFSGQFEINKYRAFSVDDILSKGSLVSKVRNLKPEVVLLHVGHHDIFWLRTSADDLISKYKQVIYKLLESTEAKICISLIIPVPGYPNLNETIQIVNDRLSSLISKLRTDSRLKYGGRIFTSSNDQLGGYITRGTDSHGVTIFLSEGGKRKAWLLLKDALQRSLGLIRDRETKLNLSRRTHKKYTNE